MPKRAVPSRFHQRYELQQYLAAGQCGEVYRARTQADVVALKIFDHAPDKTVLGYFTNEQLLLRQIREHQQHPHLAEYVDSNLVRPPFFLATRLVEGARELQSLLGKPLVAGFVARVVEQIGSALDYLHNEHPEYSPIVHRDVKPNNILIDAAGNAVLIDLSIARHPHYAVEDEPGLGTPAYMAPEQYSGGEVPATDQWALALVAVQMLTGRRLLPNNARSAHRKLVCFRDNDFADIRRLLKAKPRTSEVLLRALAYAPEQRFPSCGAFALELRAALEADGAELNAIELPTVRRAPSYGGYVAMSLAGLLASVMLLVTLSVHGEGDAAAHAPIVPAAAVVAPTTRATIGPSFRPQDGPEPAAIQPTSALIDPQSATAMPQPTGLPGSRRLSSVASETQAAAGIVNIVAASAEPLRSAPSTDARVLARIPVGASATLTGRSQPAGSLMWFEIVYAGQTGWCRSTHCTPQTGVRR